MKKVILSCILACAVVAQAQTSKPSAPTPAPTTTNPVQNLYAGGVSYSVNATPAIAGTALYARNLDPQQQYSTYAFTVLDAVPASFKPFTVTTNVGVGVAQEIMHFGKAYVWVPTAAGISWSGTNTGFQWTGGAAVTIPFKSNWYIIPSVRFLKSNVSNGSGYQPIIGVMVGFGK